jgi:hypothetical protein
MSRDKVYYHIAYLRLKNVTTENQLVLEMSFFSKKKDYM